MVRFVLALVGALVGLSLASDSRQLFDALVGAAAIFAIAEIIALRTRIQTLEDEILALRSAAGSSGAAAADRAGSPTVASAAAARDSQAGASGWSAADSATGPVGGRREGPAGVGTGGRVGTSGAIPAHAASLKAGGPASGAAGSADASERLAGRGASTTGSTATSATLGRGTPYRSAQPPAEPAIIRVIREYFTGGNTLVRVGVVILFFGVAFLLRYLAEHSHVPIQFRLSGVAVGAIALLVLGWRLRGRRPGYALAIQGGAVGILYLTVFAALRLYGLLSPTSAFVLLVLLAVFSAALAVLQNSQAFALLAVTGAFLAPILASTGHGNHVVLFSYYAVVNASLLGIAWFRAWRPLNLAGFVFTFVIGTAWGVLKYTPALFASTEPFLILFFLLYVAIAILFAIRQPPELRGYVDGTLVFGTPIVAFGLQSAMLHDQRFALAYSALVVSGFYLLVAWLLHRQQRASQRLLVEAFMAMGVVFLTLAVPLALNGRWSATTWAIEGAALVWIGCRQDRQLARAFGAFLQIAAGLVFWRDVNAPYGDIPVLNSATLGGLMVSVASVFAADRLRVNRERLRDHEQVFADVLFYWGLLWWLIAGLSEIQRRVPDPYGPSAALAFVTLTALLCSQLQRRTALEMARLPALCLLPVMLLFALMTVIDWRHPFANGGWVAWPLAFAGFYTICRRHEGEPGAASTNSLHVIPAWLLLGLLSWELAWAIEKAVAGGGSWPAIAWALVPGLTLALIPRLTARVAWPFARHREAYDLLVCGGVAVYLALWSLGTNFLLPGNSYPLPYVPLLNPLDVAQGFVLLILVRHWLHLRRAQYPLYTRENQPAVPGALAALAFIWLNASLLRTLHHWGGVAFNPDAMLSSTLAETALSIFWTVLALGAMLFATRRGFRVVWLVGAGLLAVVVAKLFLVDLSRVGTIERIVSFVGVGLLMLVIGYFSPIPPDASAATSPSEEGR